MNEQPNLVTLTNPQGAAAEAYRTLRTNLTFAALDRPLETLLVTSAAAGEDKSTVLANLAVAMAQSERRTILVDADLRHPSLHEVFGVSNERGLTTMMIDQAAAGDPPLVALGVENLWLLPSGPLPPNPADLLGSSRMDAALTRLKSQADIVLLDAPPVILVTDAAVLSTKVDGVLLVVAAGRTRRDQARQARTLLDRARAHVVGAVLSNATRGVTLGAY